MTDAAGGGRGRPLVSIGVPVYNSERFLARALDSLLGQTLADFELIISDNASRDGTAAICERYARADGRVRVLRQPRNIGAARNWNATALAARGTFFTWASGNDTRAATMLAQCASVLQADPGVVLCYGRTQLVDEHDRPFELYAGDLAVEDPGAAERFERICREMALNNAQCGLMRLDVLRRTALDRPYAAGDVALMAELALYGKFRLLPDVLLFRRQSPGAFSLLLSPLERRRFHDPDATAPLKLVRVRHHGDHLRSIVRAPLPPAEKLRTLAVALRLARWERVHVWHELRSLLGGRGGPPDAS